MAVLRWMNTIQYSPPIGPLYAPGVSLSPLKSSTRTACRSLQPFLPGSLDDRSTDRPTDHSDYSVGNDRRNALTALWRSQILLLSMATTSIYWSSRLDRSDQLQQSAAIFNCTTRRVAVYVETHYNVASKRAFPTGVVDRWHNCLLIYWRTSCLVPAFDDTQYHVPATEWYQRYLPCCLFSVFNSVCFSAHWPSFALFYWMTWPWSDDIIRPRYVRTLCRIVKFVSERAINVAENVFWCAAYNPGERLWIDSNCKNGN